MINFELMQSIYNPFYNLNTGYSNGFGYFNGFNNFNLPFTSWYGGRSNNGMNSFGSYPGVSLNKLKKFQACFPSVDIINNNTIENLLFNQSEGFSFGGYFQNLFFKNNCCIDYNAIQNLISPDSNVQIPNNINDNSDKNIIIGTNGNDYITGTSADDILMGGTGIDYLAGQAGDDTYYVDNLFDKVVESVNEGNDTIKSYKTYYLGDNIENLELIGFESTNAYGNSQDNFLTGNCADNTIYGDNGNDQIYGNAGNDILYGEVGNDYISGGSGNDQLYGAEGNDQLLGGKGNDILTDTSGSDLYTISKGDGQDIILDTDLTGEDTDIVEFTQEITKEDIAVFQSGNDLVIGYGTDDQVIIKNQFEGLNVEGGEEEPIILPAGGHTGVEMLQLADGSFLTSDDINQIIQDMTAYADTNAFELTSIEQVQNNADLMNIVVDAWS